MWIKVQTNLHEQREVKIVARELNIPPTHAMGLIVRFWAWADSNTTDGCILGIRRSDVDDVVSHVGFTAAMVVAGWIESQPDVDDGIIIPNYSRHNGQSAKDRALSAVRMAKKRAKQA